MLVVILVIIIITAFLAYAMGLIGGIFVVKDKFKFLSGMYESRKRKKIIETCPVKGIPDIEADTFEQRVTAFEAWYEKCDGNWFFQELYGYGCTGKYPKHPRPSFSLMEKMQKADLRSQLNRISDCYRKIEEVGEANLCLSGYGYLLVEFYYAVNAIQDLTDQLIRLTKLKDLAGDELSDERLDPVLSQLKSGIDCIIERHFESELLKLYKMAIAEQLGSSVTLQSRLPSGNLSHTTTSEELARLKLLVDDFLTDSSNTYREETQSV